MKDTKPKFEMGQKVFYIDFIQEFEEDYFEENPQFRNGYMPNIEETTITQISACPALNPEVRNYRSTTQDFDILQRIKHTEKGAELFQWEKAFDCPFFEYAGEGLSGHHELFIFPTVADALSNFIRAMEALHNNEIYLLKVSYDRDMKISSKILENIKNLKNRT